MVAAAVREWDGEEGWGVLDSPETPGGCFGHFSHVQLPDFRTLSPGQQVDLTWEAPGFKQDGYDYRAVSITPRSACHPRRTSTAALPAGRPQRPARSPADSTVQAGPVLTPQ